jgi:DNA polymerase-3 subunit gamma/tau
MIVQTLGEVPDELKVTAEQDERLAEQAQRVGAAAVVGLLDLVAVALRAMKDGADARTQLELALIKGARPEHDPSLRALLARVERLEGRGQGSVAPARRPEVAATAAGRAATAATAPARDADAAVQHSAGSSPPAPAEATAIVAASAEIDGGPAVTAVAVVEPGGEVGEPDVHVGVELDLPGVTELWPAVLADVQERHPMLHALMQNARPSSLDGGELTLSWAESAAFYKRKAEDPACRDQIATAIRSVTGSSLRLAYALADEDPASSAQPAPTLSDDELVEAFMREFDAEELPAEEES